MLALEFLLFSGPFFLPMLHIAAAQAMGRPVPQRFAYVPWLMGGGVALLLAWVAWSLVRMARR